jgi:hypothetical protein
MSLLHKPSPGFVDSLCVVLGIDRAAIGPERFTEPTPARLVGLSVGELAHALRFSGLMLSNGHDGVVEIRRVDSTTQEGEKR